MILLLGHAAWCDSEREDPVLADALAKLGRTGDPRSDWAGILPMTEDRYQWLAERFERRIHPPSVEILSELPWSAVFTSSVDPTLTKVFSGPGRQPEPILTAGEYPRAARSTARPPFYYLFSRAGEQDAQARPPVDTLALTTRRTQHAVPLLTRVLDTATPLGTIVVDGFKSGRDWLRFDDLLGTLAGGTLNQVLWFGGRPDMNDYDQAHFATLERENRILVEPMRLGTVVAELRAAGRLADVAPIESGDVGIVSLGDDGDFFDVTPEERLRVEAVASIVDDSWTSPSPPPTLGPDLEYDSFRRFHGIVGGPRLLVEGVRRGFAMERDFEEQLFHWVSDALADHSQLDSPIVVEGQSGTGKSVALARIVARVREHKTAPVLYSIWRIPQPEEISEFCQTADRAHARATLIVCDANRDIDDYNELLIGLRSRGRKVVVLGSQYRVEDTNMYPRIKVPATLSEIEKQRLADLLRPFAVAGQTQLEDNNFLAILYRHLPASRPRIGSGLGAEARETARRLEDRGSQPRAVDPIGQLHQQLIDKGYISRYQPLFGEQLSETSIQDDVSAGKIIDMVMVAGRLSCPVPVNLLLRAVSDHHQRIDSVLVSELFRDLDLFRWKSRDSEGNDLLVLPRLPLEAQLICQRRLESSQAEARVLVDLIGSVRLGIDDTHERDFLLNLLHQIGPDGPRGSDYKHSYVDFAHKLTELREQFNVVDASLMLQESVFLRRAVREDEVDNVRRFELLEKAREVIQDALDRIDNGQIRSAARQTRQNLLVERAAIYGFLAVARARRMAASGDIWSAYQAARVAVRKAVSAADNYYPHDVGLWTPADLFGLAELTELQQAELASDIYSGLSQVEKDTLPPGQREKFEARRMRVGRILGDHTMTEEAYVALEADGSTAGYFLRARNYAPELNKDDVEVTKLADLEKARRSADFLTMRLDKIQQDERCLWLLLENLWIAEMHRRPLRGVRQPLPVGDIRRQFLDIVRALNHAAGESSRYGTRYLEAVLTWLTEDYVAAREIFRHLYSETDNVYGGRIVLRHVVSGPNGTPVSFTGRVERQRGEGRWLIRVNELNQTIALLERDFLREDVRYGRELSGFAIAFNFIGPIADPIR